MRFSIDPAIVAENFRAFQNNASVNESAQLFNKGLPVAEMIQAFAMNRNVLSAFAAFESIYPNGQLERSILEKVILCISKRNACQFCVESHIAVTRGLGIPIGDPADPTSTEHSIRESLAIEYALAIHRNSNQVPEELFQRLRTAFTESEIVELTFLTGYINMLNWFNNTLGVRYRSEFEGLSFS